MHIFVCCGGGAACAHHTRLPLPLPQRNILGSRTWTDQVGEGGGSTYSFDVVLVDPPRAGLDKFTCRKIAAYGYIMYHLRYHQVALNSVS